MPPPTREDLWSQGQDEQVEVNQRALIDKILARYSGEHTIFRELLQNADDAGAEHVQVKFYSKAGLEALEKGEGPSKLPDVKTDPMHRYVVTNDGVPFRPQDWQRLKKIAEGNPSEETIGAFGVGFYSLFSATDDPFVESGNKWMGFYWKDGKDQLHARSGDLPPSSSSSSSSQPTATGHPWTRFTMNLREPAVLEGPLDLARFLITSLTFMRTIRQIDMLVDDVVVLEAGKKVKGREKVAKRGLKGGSPNGMMTVMGVEKTGMVIQAKVMKWLSASGFTPPPLPPAVAALAKPAKAFQSLWTSSFFNRGSTPPSAPATPPPPPPEPEDLTEITTLSRDIQVYQADIKVTVSPAFGKELERATKKAAQTRMPASLVFSRADEHEVVTGNESGKAPPKDVGGIFAGLCPPLDGEKGAKVFIGQPTGQTTGIGGHLAARFIPTVERESIDLVDRHVSHWNRELLFVGGYLSRLIYELEMDEIRQMWSTTTVSDTATRTRLLGQGLHALRFFTFKPTTPSQIVGQEMESAFFACSIDNASLPIISTAGILPVSQVRMPNAELQKFLPDLPVISAQTLEQAPRMVARLRQRPLLREAALDDVIKQLGLRPLTEKEMVDCLQWWQTVSTMDGYSGAVRNRLLDAAILIQENGKVLPLSIVGTFVKPQSSSIPTDMPLPPHTLPYPITKDLRGGTMPEIFGWTELSLLQYIQFLASPPISGTPSCDPETDLRQSPAFAERVLAMLGRAWQSVSAAQQQGIAKELKDVACIPTKAGFKKPDEAYFEKNLLFDDLPVIALPKGTAIRGGMEKMLLGIGVRKTVNLQLVFSRLVGGGTWTCQDLMKYLVSVKDTLSQEEMARLRQTAAFPLYVEPPADGSTPSLVRQKPHQLYEPTDAMRQLNLPLLDWGEGNKWKSNSEEAKMLFSLGLKRFPPVDVLLGIAAGRAPYNERALSYLLSHVHTQYAGFDPSAYSGIAFIPATTPDGKSVLAKPGEAFLNPACAILGFSTASSPANFPENAAKLRIQPDPPMDRLISALLSSPTTDLDTARKVFEYLSTRSSSTSALTLERLGKSPFIPVKTGGDVRLFRPNEVYFSSSGRDGGSMDLWKSAFTFVDFGERGNGFLRFCGVRGEPSVRDIAKLLMREPQRMLAQAGSPDKYLEQLRLLAANWGNFDVSSRQAMKTAPFLLASQRVPVKRGSSSSAKKLLTGFSAGSNSAASGEDEYEREWVLCRASEVSLIDDFSLLQYFGRHVLAAPEEHLLESFYEHLGARTLSSLVRVDYIPHGPSPIQSEQARQLKRHVLERLTIFLAEARRRQSEYTAEWLGKEGNFEVREVRELRARYTLRNGRDEVHHTETLYATATKTPKSKAITLTVSLTAQPDDYDIASALCNILLKTSKADDALLLYSILSTPLMALKKRGFNVDRILNQQREERLRLKAEAVRDREKAAAERPVSEEHTQGVMGDNQSVKSIESSSTAVGSDSSKGKTLMDRLRRRSSTSKGAGTNDGALSGMPGGLPGLNALRGMGSNAGISGGSGMATGPGGAGTKSTKRPTNLDSIRNTVQKAIDASRPEAGTQVRDSRQAVRDVSESQDDYCDTSAQADLVLAVDPGRYGPKVWVPRDVSDPETFLQDKMVICQRFAMDVLLPIGQVFKLSAEVLNIFWDHEGPLIAFNRGGTIFCNARYFAAWHDTQCQNGLKNDAFISWYFSIAHELAHNLESAHNSSHEFYFSSIAEEYLIRFTSLLQTGGAR